MTRVPPRTYSTESSLRQLPRATVAAVLLLSCAFNGSAEAQDPRPPLADDDFRIDLYQGPVIGSTRVIGLGGAYSAVAEEAVGIPSNPASVANRTYYSAVRLDWDLSFDFLVQGVFQGDSFDFENNGRSSSERQLVLSLGGLLQEGAFGLGVYVQGQLSRLLPEADGSETKAGLWLLRLATAYAFWDYQLVVGGGLRVGIFGLNETQQGSTTELFSTITVGLETGVLFRPAAWPLRLAAVFAVPLGSDTPTPCEGAACPRPFMPRGVALPWELRLGAAWQFSPRPFNPKPVYLPHDHKIDLARDYRGGRFLLVSAELVLTGGIDNAISVDGFFNQTRERSGANMSLSPRLGVASEVWRRRLRLRAGTYWEPSRFEDRTGRLHGTFAFDLRLFDFSWPLTRSLRFSSAIDFAQRYSNVSLSLGFWH